jgi:hypothetical protein
MQTSQAAAAAAVACLMARGHSTQQACSPASGHPASRNATRYAGALPRSVRLHAVRLCACSGRRVATAPARGHAMVS